MMRITVLLISAALFAGSCATTRQPAEGKATYWERLRQGYAEAAYSKAKSPPENPEPEPVELPPEPEMNFYDLPCEKGRLDLRITIPFVNTYNLHYEGERKSRVGFWGISAGLDYYLGNRDYLNFTISYIADVPAPIVPALGGVWDFTSSTYVALSHNHKLGRFSLGYGLSCGRDAWNTINYNYRKNEDDPLYDVKNIYRRSASLGLIFPVYFYAPKSDFCIGLIYRPMLVQFHNGGRFVYQHTISVDIGWRVRLKK